MAKKTKKAVKVKARGSTTKRTRRSTRGSTKSIEDIVQRLPRTFVDPPTPEDTYRRAATLAVQRGEIDGLMIAVVNSGMTQGGLDDNVLNESIGMLTWVVRQIRAKKIARGLPTAQIPVMPKRRENDYEDDDYNGCDDEGVSRELIGDPTFP